MEKYGFIGCGNMGSAMLKGILSANKGEAVKIIKQRFEIQGYKLKVFLVNFADFGVPQLRQRVLFIGVRDDIKNGTINRGKFTNADTGWNIQVSRHGLEDTVKYGVA